MSYPPGRQPDEEEKSPVSSGSDAEEVDENAFSLALGPVTPQDENVALLIESGRSMREDMQQMQMELYMLRETLHQASTASMTHIPSNGDKVVEPIHDPSSNFATLPEGLARCPGLPIFGRFNPFANNKDEEEDDLMDSQPEDSFSFMVTSKIYSIPFWSAFCVLVIQIATFTLLPLNQLQSNKGTGNKFGIPANVNTAVRVTQLIAIAISSLSQDDIRTSLDLFMKGYAPHTIGRAFGHTISRFKWALGIFVRLIEGALGLIVTFLLIVTAETVIDLLLNFTAMEFVSQLDEIFFALAQQGFIGAANKAQTELVSETKYTALNTIPIDPTGNKPYELKRKKGRPYLILILILVILMSAWGWVVNRQTTGHYLCQTLQVQLDDEFVPSLGAFGGLYDLQDDRMGAFAGEHVSYIDRQSGKAIMAYCRDRQAWTLSYADDGHTADPCMDWVAHSEETETFDILDTADHQWTVRETEGREILIDHFRMLCRDCDQEQDGHSECQGRGVCSNGVCECDEGWFGLRCELHEPCANLEMDVRFDGFEDVREWSKTFEIFELDGERVYSYNRPIYISEPKPGEFDIVVFTGRRWMATNSAVLVSAGLEEYDDPVERRHALGNYFIDHWHAYYSDFIATFLTQPMDIGTEYNSAEPVNLRWYVARPKNKLHPHDVQGIDRAVARLDAVLLCTICNEESNVCLNGGVCVDGTCECSIGSFGSICQIPPTGNGRCDPQYDVPKYGYDGGDCCEATCISGDVYHCGKDATGFIDVGYFFCIHDEGEWHRNRKNFDNLYSQPRFSLSLSTDGHILALGEPNADHVTLFDADGSEWIQRGRVMEGPLGSSFGVHVAMSKGLESTVRNPLTVDPVRIAVSGFQRNRGFVRVYECLTQGCIQSGEDLVFEDLPKESRAVHDMSSDGRILAFGGYTDSSNVTTIQFYHYEEELLQWRPEGIPRLEFLGDAYALKLSGDFKTLAIRSIIIWEGVGKDEYHQEFKATDAKAVFHYDSEADKWEQIGNTIFDEVDGSGSSPNPDDFHILGTRYRLSEFLHGADPIALSADGLVLASGLPFSTDDAGVHVYDFDTEIREWVDRGHTISNNHTNGFKGWSVVVSGDGSLIVVGTGGDETGTNTYTWDGNDWVKYGHELPGGERSSLVVSGDGGVLAVASNTVEVYHRNVKTKCPDDIDWFHFSLTFDMHPEDTRWDLVSNDTGEVLLFGGPYAGHADGFPYSSAYERSTIVAETCISRDECMVLSLYDKIDPLTDEFRQPDGMLSPAVYNLSVNGIEVATRRLDQAVDHIYFGENCVKCPEGTHALKVLVRSCVPFFWTLDEANAGRLLRGDNVREFETTSFEYLRDGTCETLELDVHSYWEERCVPVADLDQDCFLFFLGAVPLWPSVENQDGDVQLDHAHRNTEVVLLFDEKQITVDLALVGSKDVGPPSEIHYSFGGACSGEDNK